jgi:hypothetical protein
LAVLYDKTLPIPRSASHAVAYLYGFNFILVSQIKTANGTVHAAWCDEFFFKNRHNHQPNLFTDLQEDYFPYCI